MNERKHQHREAFMHMKYVGSTGRKLVVLTIWNSRDGVTPFITYLQELGITLQHSNWFQDEYDPTYKPKAGDFIWRDLTEEEARKYAANNFDKLLIAHKEWDSLTKSEKREKVNHPGRWFSPDMVEEGGKEKWVEGFMSTFLKGSPHLEKVKESWK